MPTTSDFSPLPTGGSKLAGTIRLNTDPAWARQAAITGRLALKHLF